MTPIYSFFPHLLHIVPFTSLSLLWPMWTFPWLFSFAAVTGPIYSGPSACLSLDEKSSNQSHCNLKSEVKMSILLFGLTCWSLAAQNLGIHFAGVHKIPEDVLPHFDWEVAQHHILCTFAHDDLHHSCICCAVECFVADLLGSHYDPISCLCEQHFMGLILYWQVLQFYCLAKQWPPSLSCHPGMIYKHHRSFYQVYKYPLEDISYSLVLFHCSMFYKPASPSITEQM